MLARDAETGGDQQSADLVAVPDRVGLLAQPRSADMRGRRVGEQFFFDGTAVEPGDRRGLLRFQGSRQSWRLHRGSARVVLVQSSATTACT